MGYLFNLNEEVKLFKDFLEKVGYICNYDHIYSKQTYELNNLKIHYGLLHFRKINNNPYKWVDLDRCDDKATTRDVIFSLEENNPQFRYSKIYVSYLIDSKEFEFTNFYYGEPNTRYQLEIIKENPYSHCLADLKPHKHPDRFLKQFICIMKRHKFNCYEHFSDMLLNIL